MRHAVLPLLVVVPCSSQTAPSVELEHRGHGARAAVRGRWL